MGEFFRYPHTPHLAWLGSNQPREDKVLSSEEAEALLESPIYIEEKVDGANIGISIDERCELQVQNRGQYLVKPYLGQFSRLAQWLEVHRVDLLEALPGLILFGEWLFARHSIAYDRLPDWFLAFDFYDLKSQRFLSKEERDVVCGQIGLSTVPFVDYGLHRLEHLKKALSDSKSAFYDGPPEGFFIRSEKDPDRRAKLVRSEFIQSIGEHWSSKALQQNWIRGGDLEKCGFGA
jgi:ATP-dependent RNA circularization protein (DNA/RNA ligase family)